MLIFPLSLQIRWAHYECLRCVHPAGTLWAAQGAAVLNQIKRRSQAKHHKPVRFIGFTVLVQFGQAAKAV